jgi:hypothetical protein
MKLIVRRTHEDLNGTWYFVLTTRLDLSEEEQELVSRHKLEGHTLTPGHPGGVYGPSTIADQRQGSKRIFSTLPALMNYEQALQAACAEMPRLLNCCRSFGVDQIVEFGG